MSASTLLAPNLITHPGQLHALAARLADQPFIAVDTESNSLYVYQEQVCLIQFSIPGADFLVDPLALTDLSPLAPLFADPRHEKIFHAAEYDLICLKRDFGFTIENIFDTMLAARMLGRKKIGLGSILQDEFNVTLDKKYQRANWSQRPLPSHLRAYAQLDTRYLIPLRHRLHTELQQKDLLPLAREDFERLCQVNGREPLAREELVWRINGARDLSPRQAAVLQELCRWRDETAKKMNRPVFKVMSDALLLSLAQSQPRNERQLRAAKLTDRQIHSFGQGVLAALARGLAAPPLYPPAHSYPGDDYLNRLDALADWRKQRGRAAGVESDIILPREHMARIARHNPSSAAELAALMQDIPWRYEQYGQQILQVLRRMKP